MRYFMLLFENFGLYFKRKNKKRRRKEKAKFKNNV